MTTTVRDILRVATFRRDDVEKSLSSELKSWVKFDSDLGYIPADMVMADGIDESFTQYTYESPGHRRLVNYRDNPCRINTYGNSYTQCQQVSDGETWQEYLAAHLREPIRNFGSGGYGLSQAVRRAFRIEETESGSDFVILNIFDDDHIRSLDAVRWIRTAWRIRHAPPEKRDQFHGLPWTHVRYDLQRKEFIEVPGHCKTPDDLRELCNPDRFYNTFKDDQIVRLFALQMGASAEVGDLEDLAQIFGIQVNLRNSSTIAMDARKLHLTYGYKASEYVLNRFRDYLSQKGKRLLILMSYGENRLTDFLERGERIDQPFIDHLQATNQAFIDGLEKHRLDFNSLGISCSRYLSRYFIQPAGAAVFEHYSPAGNHFFAFAIKNGVVDLLDPKPKPYRNSSM